MAGEERFLASKIHSGTGNAKLNINGLVGFVRSFNKTGGGIDTKRITDGASPHEMEQDGRLKLPEYDGVLAIPAANYQAYVDSYREGTVLNTFYTNLDSSTYLAQFGDYRIVECNWDAAILENDEVTVKIKIRAKGYGTTTDVTP